MLIGCPAAALCLLSCLPCSGFLPPQMSALTTIQFIALGDNNLEGGPPLPTSMRHPGPAHCARCCVP